MFTFVICLSNSHSMMISVEADLWYVENMVLSPGPLFWLAVGIFILILYYQKVKSQNLSSSRSMMISVENMVLSPGPHSEMKNPVGSSHHGELDISITRWNPVRNFLARCGAKNCKPWHLSFNKISCPITFRNALRKIKLVWGGLQAVQGPTHRML